MQFSRDAVADYYRRIAKFILPHLKQRPLSFKRYPGAVKGESFWEKDAPSFTPEWVPRFAVPRRSGESEIEYIVVNNVRTLMWIASVGGIELHPFLHRVPKIDQPTSVVFDLDPGTGANVLHSCRVAVLLRDALETAGLKSFAKTSGSKGIQIYVPLNTPVTYAVTEVFSRGVADAMARKYPKLIVSKMTKSLRVRKVFIDWSQNSDYKTTVAVYSLRAKRDRPYVSTPLKWSEVENARRVGDLDFEPEEALKRVARLGDLFKPVLTMKQRLGVAGSAPGPVGNRRPRAAAATPAGLPKARSQSGRRLFVLMKTDMGNELWMDVRGKFKRWILRKDREGGAKLIAMPAGQFPIDPAYYRGEVPEEWRSRVRIEDAGTYEVVASTDRRLDLFFNGKVMSGEWILEKVTDDKHRSWTLRPADGVHEGRRNPRRPE